MDRAQAAMRRDPARLHRDGLAEGLHRLLVAAGLGEELAQVAPRARVGRLEPHRLAKGGFRVRVPALRVEGHAEPAVERRRLRLERERLAVRGLGLRVPPLPAQAEGEVRPRDHVLGIETHRLAQGGLGLREPALPAHGDAELDVEVRVLGREGHRAAELSLGGAKQPLRFEREPEVGVQVGVARLELDDPLVHAHLVGPLGLAAVDRREGEVRVQPTRLAPDRLDQGGLRLRVAALPLEHAAEPRPPAGAARVEARRPGECPDRLAIPPLPLEHEPEAPVQDRRRGPQRDRRAIRLRGLAPAALAPMGLGVLHVHARRGGIEVNGTAEGDGRLRVAAERGEGRAEPAVRNRVGRGQAQRGLECAHRLLGSPQPGEGHREGVVRLAAARGQTDRLARGGLLLRRLAEPPADRGEPQPRGGMVALAADRGPERPLRGRPLALPLERQAQLELRLHAARIERQGRGQRLLGVGVAPLAEGPIAAVETERELGHLTAPRGAG